MIKHVVVAGNYRQFVHWRDENKYRPNSNEIVYADRLEKIMGLSLNGVEVHKYGTYYERDTVVRIIEEIESRKNR